MAPYGNTLFDTPQRPRQKRKTPNSIPPSLFTLNPKIPDVGDERSETISSHKLLFTGRSFSGSSWKKMNKSGNEKLVRRTTFQARSINFIDGFDSQLGVTLTDSEAAFQTTERLAGSEIPSLTRSESNQVFGRAFSMIFSRRSLSAAPEKNSQGRTEKTCPPPKPAEISKTSTIPNFGHPGVLEISDIDSTTSDILQATKKCERTAGPLPLSTRTTESVLAALSSEIPVSSSTVATSQHNLLPASYLLEGSSTNSKQSHIRGKLVSFLPNPEDARERARKDKCNGHDREVRRRQPLAALSSPAYSLSGPVAPPTASEQIPRGTQPSPLQTVSPPQTRFTPVFPCLMGKQSTKTHDSINEEKLVPPCMAKAAFALDKDDLPDPRPQSKGKQVAMLFDPESARDRARKNRRNFADREKRRKHRETVRSTLAPAPTAVQKLVPKPSPKTTKRMLGTGHKGTEHFDGDSIVLSLCATARAKLEPITPAHLTRKRGSSLMSSRSATSKESESEAKSTDETKQTAANRRRSMTGEKCMSSLPSFSEECKEAGQPETSLGRGNTVKDLRMATYGSHSTASAASLKVDDTLLPQEGSTSQPMLDNKLFGESILTMGVAMQGKDVRATTVEQQGAASNRVKHTGILMEPLLTLSPPTLIPLAKATKQHRAAQERHSFTCNFWGSIFGLDKPVKEGFASKDVKIKSEFTEVHEASIN